MPTSTYISPGRRGQPLPPPHKHATEWTTIERYDLCHAHVCCCPRLVSRFVCITYFDSLIDLHSRGQLLNVDAWLRLNSWFAYMPVASSLIVMQFCASYLKWMRTQIYVNTNGFVWIATIDIDAMYIPGSATRPLPPPFFHHSVFVSHMKYAFWTWD